MASVHFGRLAGAAGFSRVVAIKRLYPSFAKDPEFVTMFLDEARLVARIRHINVVPTLDVVATDGEVFLVMDYVHGQSLAKLWRATLARKKQNDPRIVASIMSGVLHGLHAAHEARGERGESLQIIHRDVSPQNIVVGVDGLSRVLDFGVAKAAGRVQTTRQGRIKGKIAYMPPEQLQGGRLGRQTDLYAAAVVTWEMLTGQRAFGHAHEGAVIEAILARPLSPPSKITGVSAAFDDVVMRALSRNPAQRYATAREMALELERCVGVASLSEVGEWVQSLAHEELSRRAVRLSAIDTAPPMGDADKTLKVAASEVPTRPSEDSGEVHSAEHSTVSHVAVSPTMWRLMRRSQRRIAVTACIGIASMLGAIALTRSNARKVPSTAVVSVPSPAVSIAPVVPLEPAAAGPWASPALVSAGTPQPISPHPSLAVQRHAPRLAAPPSRPPSTPAKRECDPPFTLDDGGHKHFKAECLP